MAASGELPAGRLLAVGTGPLAELDRETVVHLGATVERRLAGRPVRALAIWLGDLAGALDGGAAAVAELLARGVVEGSFDPAAIYRAAPEASPPALDELILVAPGADATAARRGRRARRRSSGRATNLTRRLANRAANDVSPEVLADEARAIAEAHGLWIDVIDEVRAAELGMGMFLAVGRGSANPPRMIVRALGRRGREGRPGPPPRPRRQGRLLRFRAASPSSRPTGWRR